YDAQGRRVKRTFDSNGAAANGVSVETYVYSEDNLTMRFGNTGELTHRYLSGPAAGQVLADEVFAAAGGEEYSQEVLWLLGDHQNSVRDIANSEGILRKHVDYDSFGKVISEQTLNGFNGAAVDQLFYFAGQERDRTTGLQEHGARWYNPSMGRFL